MSNTAVVLETRGCYSRILGVSGVVGSECDISGMCEYAAIADGITIYTCGRAYVTETLTLCQGISLKKIGFGVLLVTVVVYCMCEMCMYIKPRSTWH